MSTQEKEVPPLDQEATARLTDFARACKAAARAVTLYPSTHPAIRLSLARLVDHFLQVYLRPVVHHPVD